MESTSVVSPGGWARMLNAKVASALLVGTLAAGGGVHQVYGYFQGAKASHICEAALVSTTKDTVAYSCLNPLPDGETGAILPSDTNGIFIAETTAPATRLNVGTATTSTGQIVGTSSAANVMSGVVLEGPKRWLPLSTTGAIAAATSHGATPILLAPRDDEGGRRFLNVTFKRGSGATASGNPPASIHIEITPCNIGTIDC